MKKEVAKKESSTEVGEAINLDEWGGSPITSKDIVLPQIYVMQPMSDKVTDGAAAFGELRESLNNELLGDFKKPLEIVPFYLQKVFIEYNNDDPLDKKFLRVVQITPSNDGLPYQDTETVAGKTMNISRDRCMNYYCLLPKEIEAGTAIPYIIGFRRTSIKAGQKMATQMYIKNKDANKPPPSVICEISVKKDSNDKGTFAVMDATFTKPTPDHYIAECKRWMKLILAGQTKVDDSEFAASANEETVSATTPGKY